MKEFEILKPEILQNLMNIEFGDDYFDLHNDYKCYQIQHFIEKGELKLSFKASEVNSLKKSPVHIIFKEIDMKKISFISGELDEIMTIDSLYRGRFEENSILREYSTEGKAYYYLEFYDGYRFELFASNIAFLF